jgi:hypothetical protein
LETNMIYYVCDACAVAICNDDYSGMDEESITSLVAWLEVVGMLANEGESDKSLGYWNCNGCNAVEIGTANTFESVG